MERQLRKINQLKATVVIQVRDAEVALPEWGLGDW